MKRIAFRAALLASALSVIGHPPVALALGGPGDEPKIESLPVEGSKVVRVRATVAVQAPVDRVRAVVFDFPRYPRFVPRYKKAAILAGTLATGLTVRMDLEELGGLVHFWMRTQISPPARTGAIETYDGRLLEGNVRAFSARWELERLATDRTRLRLESYLAIASASMVNQGARDGVRATILALKSRSEVGPVAAAPRAVRP